MGALASATRVPGAGVRAGFLAAVGVFPKGRGTENGGVRPRGPGGRLRCRPERAEPVL